MGVVYFLVGALVGVALMGCVSAGAYKKGKEDGINCGYQLGYEKGKNNGLDVAIDVVKELVEEWEEKDNDN